MNATILRYENAAAHFHNLETLECGAYDYVNVSGYIRCSSYCLSWSPLSVANLCLRCSPCHKRWLTS